MQKSRRSYKQGKKMKTGTKTRRIRKKYIGGHTPWGNELFHAVRDKKHGKVEDLLKAIPHSKSPNFLYDTTERNAHNNLITKRSPERFHHMTPLIMAIENKDKRMVRTLLENGADPNFPREVLSNHTKVYPLYYAAQTSTTMMKELLEKGAYPDNGITKQNVNVETVLQHLCGKAKLDVKDRRKRVKLLLEHGASPYTDTGIYNEKNSIQLAIQNNRIDILKLFRDNGVDIKTQLNDTLYDVRPETRRFIEQIKDEEDEAIEKYTVHDVEDNCNFEEHEDDEDDDELDKEDSKSTKRERTESRERKTKKKKRSFKCPITFEPLENKKTMKLSDGHCYSLEAISELYKSIKSKTRENQVSPMTRGLLTTDEIQKMGKIAKYLESLTPEKDKIAI